MGRRVLTAVAVCLTLAACAGTPSVTGRPQAAPAAASAPASDASGTDASSPKPTPSPTEAQTPCGARVLAFDGAKTDLTGSWLGNDNGIYYLRQLGTDLWWNGMSGQVGQPALMGREWNNVAHGTIADDLTITLDWADVPRGDILGHGTLTWVIEEVDGSTRLRKTGETGTGFGGALFTPCGPG
jgi:hypothetical protein